MKYIIGADIGTSGTKAIAFSHEGKILEVAYRAYEPVPALAEYHELDPELLFRAFVDGVEEVVGKLKNAELTGISFSSAMHSLMLVDASGVPLTNLITWADLRSREQADRLKRSPEAAEIYKLSGTPIHPMSPLSKIIWFREQSSELFAKAAKFISIKEFIIYKISGKYLVDYSLASATGLFDIYKLQWNPVALEIAGINVEQLSEAVTTTHIEKAKVGKLETEIVLGASDGCLANLGSSAVRNGDVSVTIGTSGAVRMVSDSPKYDEKARIFNYVLTPELFVSGGPINNGGVLLKWYNENVLEKDVDDSGDFDDFVKAAAAIEPGCDGLVFLPYVQGERAPVWDANAKGVFFGIKAAHKQAHFMRSIIEGICFSLLDVSLSLEETLGEIKNVYASGGFTKSPAWVQILSDILGKKIQITDTADASSIGAAMLAMFATGAVTSVEETTGFLSVQKAYVPDLTHKNIYQKNFVTYRSLYTKLKDEF
ncbi:MAG: gluconate kinase [Chitinophagaceae bacterium]|nr:MAG: gluconate kinase [Chitinophagaceae bacterium]